MPIGTLFKDGVDAYLEEEKDTSGAMWFFLHIPKTAGSSFRSELAGALKPNDNIVIDYKRPDVPFDAQKQAVVERFIENVHATPWRFASGHLHYPHVRAIAEAHGNARILTVLRDPVKRVISDYRYQCTPLHPPHEAFKREFPTFQDYAASAASQNKMFSFLAESRREKVDSVIERMDRTFAFVGLLEMYALSFRLMFTLLGQRRGPEVYTRKTQDTEANKLSLDDADLATLRKANHLDARIFGHYRRNLVEAREKIVARLALRRRAVEAQPSPPS